MNLKLLYSDSSPVLIKRFKIVFEVGIRREDTILKVFYQISGIFLK